MIAKFGTASVVDDAPARLDTDGCSGQQDLSRRRVVVAGIALLSSLALVPASAAPIRCKQIVDQGGDARASAPPGSPEGPQSKREQPPGAFYQEERALEQQLEQPSYGFCHPTALFAGAE